MKYNMTIKDRRASKLRINQLVRNHEADRLGDRILLRLNNRADQQNCAAAAIAVLEEAPDQRPAAARLFASMRFRDGQPLPEAIALQNALSLHNIELCIVNVAEGDMVSQVMQSIQACDAFVAFGTVDYAERTGCIVNSQCEHEYAYKTKMKIIRLNMLDVNRSDQQKFKYDYANWIFNAIPDRQYFWAEKSKMPADLVNNILAIVKTSTSPRIV